MILKFNYKFHHLLLSLDFFAILALAGLTSVLLVMLLGQPRILMAMARDGLLPKHFFTDIHPVYKTPYKSTLLTGLFVASLSSLVPLTILVEVVSMGTLSAFILVNVSIIVLRKTQPNLHRPFRCPYVPYVPGLGAITCFIMMISLPSANWIRLIVWWSIGACIYYFYGRHHGLRRGHLIEQEESLTALDGDSVDKNEINIQSINKIDENDDEKGVEFVVSPVHVSSHGET